LGSRASREEKPADFERITLEYNAIYNQILALVRDRNTKPANEVYSRLCNIYLKIDADSLTKAQKEIIETRMNDVSYLLQPGRQMLSIKNKKI